MSQKIKSPAASFKAMRHSCEHVLHQALINLYGPKIQEAMGPATADGFYIDLNLKSGLKIAPEDFPKIEKEMKKIIDSALPITQTTLSFSKAKKLFSKNPYKLEWLDIFEKNGEKEVSIFSTGPDFSTLCQGPHVKNTKEIGPFKLLSLAGAYWHGDEKNKMLTRLYGTCFPSQKEIDEFVKQQEEAKKRDHRKLNKTLKLYQTSKELGQGLVILLPNGAIIADELEAWAKETEHKWGYVRVYTPHIASDKLFKKTGHVPYYLPHMYPAMNMEEKGEGEKETYYLKPMNCAVHHLVFKDEPRSYRDLPLRIAEYGCVYRYESSGEIHGMMRVRGPIHQNDAHIFCTPEQAEEEFQKVMDLHKYYYDTFGLTAKDYYLSFAIRDKNNKDKYLGNDKDWDKAEKITLDYVKKSGIPYEIEEGGAAFYGPKIDFNIKTVTGKVFSASTNQIDFFIPQAFNLEYTDKNGKKKVPVCIHRAPLGAHVRFIAFLTEHFAAAFPLWLSPLQVKIIPITDNQENYAQKVKARLEEEGIRVKIDDQSETMQAKIRQAQLEKVPYMLILGKREASSPDNQVSVRQRDGQNLGAIPLEKFINSIKKQIKEKNLNLTKI